MTTIEFLANVLLIAIVVVLVLGGATAGLYALTIYLLMRAKGPLGQRVSERLWWRSGAILLGVGTLGLLGSIPRYFGVGGPVAGTWAVTLAGAFMVVLGRLFMVRHREQVR
jgi:hypothetical protein